MSEILKTRARKGKTNFHYPQFYFMM